MEDKEILALLEDIEWEGYDDSYADYPEDVTFPVCPSCQGQEPHDSSSGSFNNEGRGHHNNCNLVRAIAELKERPNRVGPCPYCKEGTLVSITLKNYCTKVKGVDFVVDEAIIKQCNSCDGQVFSAKERKRWEAEFEKSKK